MKHSLIETALGLLPAPALPSWKFLSPPNWEKNSVAQIHLGEVFISLRPAAKHVLGSKSLFTFRKERVRCEAYNVLRTGFWTLIRSSKLIVNVFKYLNVTYVATKNVLKWKNKADTPVIQVVFPNEAHLSDIRRQSEFEWQALQAENYCAIWHSDRLYSPPPPIHKNLTAGQILYSRDCSVKIAISRICDNCHAWRIFSTLANLLKDRQFNNSNKGDP